MAFIIVDDKRCKRTGLHIVISPCEWKLCRKWESKHQTALNLIAFSQSDIEHFPLNMSVDLHYINLH